jgi:hypothetical protein
MVWLKLTDDFDDQCFRKGIVGDVAWTHVQGLLYCMRRETGGWIDDRAVTKTIDSPDAEAHIIALCDVKFWVREEGGFQIVHGMKDQPEPEVIDKRRAMTQERVRRHRLKLAGLEDSGNGVTECVTKSATRRVTRDGTGRVRSDLVPQQSNPALEEEGWGDEEEFRCIQCQKLVCECLI